MDLLRRLVVAVGNPFENLDAAAALLERTGHNAEAIEFLDQLVKASPWNASYRLRLAKAQLVAMQDASSATQALVNITSSPNNSYDVRSNAALALNGQSHSDLGSGELNLLAQSRGPISPLAADKFYFYESRIKAAASVPDQQTRLQLLSHCVIDFPRRDEARIPLFEAAATAHSDEFALGIIQPFLERGFMRSYKRRVQEPLSAAEETEDNGESDLPSGFVVKLSRAQQAEVAQQVGGVMLRLHRLTDALEYFQAARRSEPSPQVRARLDKTIAEVRAELNRQRQNAARQPILHDALEQDRLVRPRLLARSSPVTARSGTRGVKQ
jgi:tetratricopeptide (TPR) repeat protein